MESYKNEVDDKSATFDSEEDDNMDDESESDPKVLLGRKIYNYNKQVDAELFRLQLKEGMSYEGALRVYHHNGIEENMRALKISNETTVAELIPMLFDKFKPEMRNTKDPIDYNNHYIIMILDGVERELEPHETPLQIALDSLKSPTPPRFIFKYAGFRMLASPIIPKRSSYQQQGGESGDYSLGVSRYSLKELKHGSPKQTGRSKSTSGSSPIHTFSRSYEKDIGSPASVNRSLKLQKKDRPISLVNIVGNLSRTVKAKKKTRHGHTTYEAEESISVKGLLSPIPIHKEFVEAKLLQIYGGSLGKGPVYKSVLVSEIATTTEVIKEALDRYDIAHSNYSEYCLCDVVGRSEDPLNERLTGSNPGDTTFVTHHIRVLSESEYPVAVEQYWTVPAGYERRFELRLIRDIYTSPSCSSKRTSGDSENYLSDGSSLDDLDDMLNHHRVMNSYHSGSHIDSEGSRQISQGTLVSYHHGDVAKSYYNVCPKEIPYLMNLKPHLNTSGLLNPFGPGVLHVKLSTESVDAMLNVEFSKDLDLSTTHIFQLHCYRNADGRYSAELFVESGAHMEISLNGCLTSQCRAYELCTGDIIEVGKQQYIFMYINPTASNEQSQYRWLPFASMEQSVMSPGSESVFTPITCHLSTPFAAYHQDTLLNSVISKLDDRDTECKLLSAYVIASALHYATKHHSKDLCVNVIQKAADKIQQVIWNTAKYLTDWDPDIEIRDKAIPAMDKTLAMLQPVVYWIANTTELYHYIRGFSIQLDLQDQAVQEALVILSNAVTYAFQQTFYPVGKVVYKTLLAILHDDMSSNDNNRKSCGWVMELVVDLLQSVLDLLTDHWINISVISQFYSNVFYFLDHSLLNSLMEMIKEQDFVTTQSGPVIRVHLNMLEGWACGIGLKEEVLENLARLSAAADLLASQEAELVQMKWSSLREQFPMLNAAQLHYLLEHYKLSVARPDHWTPSEPDKEEAANLDMLSDNFKNYPSFTIPINNHYLSLIGEPPESSSYYSFLSYLRTLLLSYDAEESTLSNIDGTVDQPSANTTEFPTPLHPRHRLLRRNSETESTGRVPSKEDVLSSSMSAATDLHQNLQAMSSGSHTESHEDMLQSSHLTGSEDELNFISKDHSLSNSDLTKNVHRSSDSVNQQKGKDGSMQCIGGRSYTDSPVEFSQCAGPNYSVKVVDINNKTRRAGTHNLGLDDNEELNCSQESTGSVRLFPATNDPRACTVVIPRGRKGFGILLVEGEHGDGGDPGIFIQSIVPGSTAEECKKISIGDQVIAIDGQSLDGADYKIAFGYLKNAEDEVMITVLPGDDRLL